MYNFHIKSTFNNLKYTDLLKFSIIILGIVFYLYYGIYKIIFVNIDLAGGDFKHLYRAVQNYINGRQINMMPENSPLFFYPPLSILIFLPFSFIEQNHAILIFFLLSHLLMLSSAWIVYKMGIKTNKTYSILATVAVFGFSMPLYSSIFTGNINIIIFFVFVLIYNFTIHSKNEIIPILLSYLAFLKIFPAIYGLVFLQIKNLRLFKIFIFFLFLWGMISIGIFGLNEHLNFLKTLPKGIEYATPIFYNMSFTFILRFFLSEQSKILITTLNLIFAIVLLSFWWIITRKQYIKKNEYSRMLTNFFILTVIITILFPASSFTYNVYLIVPFYFIILSWFLNKRTFKFFFVFAFLFCLINFWEIIIYQLPITPDGVTIKKIGDIKNDFPILYPLFYCMPFIFNLAFYFWLLLNYNNLVNALTSIKESL